LLSLSLSQAMCSCSLLADKEPLQTIDFFCLIWEAEWVVIDFWDFWFTVGLKWFFLWGFENILMVQVAVGGARFFLGD
jgi:hypothetical protein